jgi:NAD(P)H-hydrate epimerase
MQDSTKQNSQKNNYTQFRSYFSNLVSPEVDSHKGQNGKVLVVGGSELFHAASKWSLDIASKLVDMVFYASVPSNNELVAQEKQREYEEKHQRQAKQSFWNGIVVAQDQVRSYAEEADVILIGPGMDRSTVTANRVHDLVRAFPAKKWVIDAGALQMIDPRLIPTAAILTPHQGELEMLLEKGFKVSQAVADGVTFLVKGKVDTIYARGLDRPLEVIGGNPGMTKGGTGDVLAGLVAGLYATQTAVVATVVSSVTNKAAGDSLYERVGPYFNASDLVDEVPQVLWRFIQQS